MRIKRIKIGNALFLLDLLVIVLVAATYLSPSNVLRIILGIPFVLFFPGYALMAALCPSRVGIGAIERVALSFGLSFAVVSLIGLTLNYTPWGIGLESLLYSIALYILIMSIVAWLRQRRLAETERFEIEFNVTLPGCGKGIWDRALTIILVLIALGALGTFSYVIVTPKVGQKFTEFYFLRQEGKVTEYPSKLRVGEEGTVTIGIVNHEYETISYWVEVRIDGVKYNEVGSIVLDNDDEWEQEVSFIPQKVGQAQKVEFLLYKDGELEPCLAALYFWVDVTQP